MGLLGLAWPLRAGAPRPPAGRWGAADPRAGSGPRLAAHARGAAPAVGRCRVHAAAADEQQPGKGASAAGPSPSPKSLSRTLDALTRLTGGEAPAAPPPQAAPAQAPTPAGAANKAPALPRFEWPGGAARPGGAPPSARPPPLRPPPPRRPDDPAGDAFLGGFLGSGWGPLVPWTWPTVLQGLLSAQIGFLIAGTAAPLVVIRATSGTLGPDVEALVARVEGLLQGTEYYKVVLTAELLQILIIGSALAVLTAPHWPLPGDLGRVLPWQKLGPPPPLPPPPPSAPASVAASLTAVERLSPPPAPRLPPGEALSAPGAPPVSVARRWAPESTSGSESWLGEALTGGAAALTLITLATLAARFAGLAPPSGGAASNSLIALCFAGGAPGIAALLASTCVGAPILEETLFRGFLLASLTKWIPPWAAVGTSALIFALLHDQSSADTLQLLILGGVAGTVYCRTRVLAAPMIVHASYNLATLLLFWAWTGGGPGTGGP